MISSLVGDDGGVDPPRTLINTTSSGGQPSSSAVAAAAAAAASQAMLAEGIINETDMLQESPVYWTEIPIIQLTILALYVLIFVVAVCGNTLVVYVVLRKRKMRTVTNLFICNLALSDLIVNFTSLWITPAYMFLQRWPFGQVLCTLLPMFQGTSIFISTLTLTSIAVDRYVVIVRNSQSVAFNDRMSINRCLLIIGVVWLVSAAVISPLAFSMKLAQLEMDGRLVCSENFSILGRLVFGYSVCFLQFIVPFTVIGISYRRIWIFLSERQWASERTIETRRRKKLLSMLIIMVVMFGICWLPTNLLNFMRDLKLERLFVGHQFLFWALVTHMISMTATCWNPILYSWMNEQFRDEFREVLPDWPCVQRWFAAEDVVPNVAKRESRAAVANGKPAAKPTSLPRDEGNSPNQPLLITTPPPPQTPAKRANNGDDDEEEGDVNGNARGRTSELL